MSSALEEVPLEISAEEITAVLEKEQRERKKQASKEYKELGRTSVVDKVWSCRIYSACMRLHHRCPAFQLQSAKDYHLYPRLAILATPQALPL